MIDPELMLRLVREAPLIAFDTETTGLTVRDKVVGWVVTTPDVSLYTPVRHEPGGNIVDVEGFERELDRAFSERTRLGYCTVGHHLGFDLRCAARHRVYPGSPLEDTMINEALIKDTTLGYGLDDCATRWKVPAKKGAELYAEIARRFGGIASHKSMKDFWRMPGDHPLVIEYATGDGITTLALREKQHAAMAEMELDRVFKLECDLIPYLARIHHRGIKIDMEYGASITPKINAEMAEKLKLFPPGFNVRSPKDVEQLYRLNGYGDDRFNKTDKGALSFTESWLETNEIGDAILSVRRLAKARDSFATPLVDTHNIDGRIHPVLNQSKSDDYGVAGARLSCSEPNMQAFPKRNIDVGRVCRRLVVPDDGMVLEEADAKQQEPRLFTHYSGDPALLHGYNSGHLDIHDRSNYVLQLNDRDRAKRLGMGMLTMMSVPTLAGHMRCTKEEAQKLHRAFLDDAFPMIRDFQQKAIQVYKSRGYVRSIMGRIAHCDDRRFAYKAVSRIIQNSGGDHLKLCMLRACQYEDAYPDKINILLSIHDSMMWQRDPGHDNAEIVRALENVATELEIKVPIPFDVGSGDNWARASYGAKLDKYED